MDISTEICYAIYALMLKATNFGLSGLLERGGTLIVDRTLRKR